MDFFLAVMFFSALGVLIYFSYRITRLMLARFRTNVKVSFKFLYYLPGIALMVAGAVIWFYNRLLGDALVVLGVIALLISWGVRKGLLRVIRPGGGVDDDSGSE